MKNILSEIFKKHVLIGLLRYFLGLSIIPYGLTKIMETQFVVSPFSTWIEPLENLNGVSLTWAFLGYSSKFTILLGLLEFIPGVLCLFRKTYYLGALLLFPVLLNVTLINFAMDLWINTQLISLLLLTINLILLLLGWRNILAPFIKKVINNQTVNNYIKLEGIINIILIGFTIFFTGRVLLDFKNQRNFLTGDWFKKKNNIWTVEHQSKQGSNDLNLFQIGDKLFFNPRQILEYSDLDKNTIYNFSYVLDEAETRLEFKINDSTFFDSKYLYESDSILILKQSGGQNDQREVVLKRRTIDREK